MLHKLGLWNRNPNFMLQVQHLELFGSGHPRVLGLRLHSLELNVLQLNFPQSKLTQTQIFTVSINLTGVNVYALSN